MTYNQSTLRQIVNITQGIRVDTAPIAAGGATRKVLFNVVGGECIITNLVGVVTTLIGAGATNVHWDTDPTAGTDVNLSAGAGTAIANREAGGYISVTGVFADNAPIWNAGAGETQTSPFIVSPGTIGMVMSADCGAGAIRYSIWYIPADPGAYIEAA